MTDLGTLGGKGSTAVAVNERGQIVGRADTGAKDDGRPIYHAFLWRSGRMLDLGTLGGNESSVVAINDRGHIVGSADIEAEDEGFSIEHAFLWENSRMHDLGTLGGKSSSALAMNERGQVIGLSDTAVLADGFVHQSGFLWRTDTMRDLGLRFRPALPLKDWWVQWPSTAINDGGQVVGDVRSGRQAAVWANGRTRILPMLGKGSRAFDINGEGVVVGKCAVGRLNLAHPCLWRNANVRDLGVAHGDRGTAVAVNDRGQVIGNSRAANAPEHAFFWENGRMTDLGTLPGGKFSTAVAISERGQIVGYSGTKQGGPHAVLWTLKRG
jgi:probable HAF family extracellular repeat protein